MLLYFFSPNEPVKYVYFALLVLLCLFLLWLSVMLILKNSDYVKNINKLENDFKELQNNQYYSCKIINCFDSSGICLCTSSPHFNGNILVCFYLKEDNFELLIAYGVIVNIQDDGYAQIKPTSLNDNILKESSLSLLEFLKEKRQNIIVKSTISLEILNKINKELF